MRRHKTGVSPRLSLPHMTSLEKGLAVTAGLCVRLWLRGGRDGAARGLSGEDVGESRRVTAPPLFYSPSAAGVQLPLPPPSIRPCKTPSLPPPPACLSLFLTPMFCQRGKQTSVFVVFFLFSRKEIHACNVQQFDACSLLAHQVGGSNRTAASAIVNAECTANPFFSPLFAASCKRLVTS